MMLSDCGAEFITSTWELMQGYYRVQCGVLNMCG